MPRRSCSSSGAESDAAEAPTSPRSPRWRGRPPRRSTGHAKGEALDRLDADDANLRSGAGVGVRKRPAAGPAVWVPGCGGTGSAPAGRRSAAGCCDGPLPARMRADPAALGGRGLPGLGGGRLRRGAELASAVLDDPSASLWTHGPGPGRASSGRGRPGPVHRCVRQRAGVARLCSPTRATRGPSPGRGGAARRRWCTAGTPARRLGRPAGRSPSSRTPGTRGGRPARSTCVAQHHRAARRLRDGPWTSPRGAVERYRALADSSGTRLVAAAPRRGGSLERRPGAVRGQCRRGARRRPPARLPRRERCRPCCCSPTSAPTRPGRLTCAEEAETVARTAWVTAPGCHRRSNWPPGRGRWRRGWSRSVPKPYQPRKSVPGPGRPGVSRIGGSPTLAPAAEPAAPAETVAAGQK